MNASQLISRYEQLSLLTGQMRCAAEQGDWDRLVELENSRARILDEVKSLDATAVLSAPELQRRSECIDCVLSHDAAIRDLVQKHIGQVQLNLESAHNTQRLRQAYGV